MGADTALQTSWVSVESPSLWSEVFTNDEIFQGFDFIERVVESESRRNAAISIALDNACADGDLPTDLEQYIHDNSLLLNGPTDLEFDLLIKLAVDWAVLDMNCDAFGEFLDQKPLSDAAGDSAARECLAETRMLLEEFHTNFADAVVRFIASNPQDVLDTGGVYLPEVLESGIDSAGLKSICTPLSRGSIYSFFINSGLSSQAAASLACKASSSCPDAIPYGIERYSGESYRWDPIVFARNLQRATLAGNLAGEFLNHDRLANLTGEECVASCRGFGLIMRYNLGFIYSRLKCNAWSYIVRTRDTGSYDWLHPHSPWQIHSLVMEFDPNGSCHFRTQSNANLNRRIYDDIEEALNSLFVPLPDYSPTEPPPSEPPPPEPPPPDGPAIDITIE